MEDKLGEYIESSLAKVEHDGKSRISLYIGDSVIERLKRLANEDNRSLSSYINIMLERAIDKENNY